MYTIELLTKSNTPTLARLPTLVGTIITSASTTNGTSTTNTLYGDALGTGWSDWSYNTTNDFATTSPVYSGTDAIAVTYAAAYGGLYLHNSGFNTTGSTHLHLAFRSPSASPSLQAIAYNSGGTPTGTTANLATYVPGGTIAANTWYAIDIPLSAIAASSMTLTGIALQDANTGLIYYDDIRIINASSSSATTTTTSYIHTDNLGSPNVTSNAAGAAVQTLGYYPFGGVQTQAGPSSPREYIGEMYDQLSGLNYP